jgi:hypothetical protein
MLRRKRRIRNEEEEKKEEGEQEKAENVFISAVLKQILSQQCTFTDTYHL